MNDIINPVTVEAPKVLSKCQCQFCQDSRRWRKAMSDRDTDQLITIVDELVNRVILCEFDNSYYRAIFAGNWPGGRETVTHVLERINIHEAEEKAKEEAQRAKWQAEREAKNESH